ncbi:MAG: 50S ribosomal protein L22 [Ilumatobacteraceae bacterium]
MTGPKLNEATMVAGERSGTKASAMYLRVSAYKARVVLNLIRGLPVKRADEILQFSDREVSNDIRKVLASAVANAQHNDEQDPEELFVKACFADEGPTLKRFTPRARGRGNRINKRTCHITIVLARLDEARLEIVQAREAKRTAAGRRRPAAAGTSASRRARVERSRQRAAAAKGGAPEVHDHDHGDDHDHDHDHEDVDQELIDTSAFEADEVEAAADVEETTVTEGAEGSASDEAQASRGESAAADEPAADAAADDEGAE